MADLRAAGAEAAEHAYLQTPRAIRERAGTILAAARRDELDHFRICEERLADVAERVIAVTRQVYPDFRAIPYHGRYRHFDAGGVPRLKRFLASLSELSREDRLRASTELVITSVLLDAGAGPDWSYREADGSSFTRSEGLAVASYHLLQSGTLSSSGAARADALGLSRLDTVSLSRAFQVNAENPLTGVEGRARLLAELGRVVASTPTYFDSDPPTLGDLGVYLSRKATAGRLPARDVLSAVLDALGSIWPGRESLSGKPLGDVWRHARFGLVPLHKLSQWLSYSLLEPLEAAGVTIEHLDELTGLAEYRNGGLFLDTEVLRLRDPSAAGRVHAVSSELVIEWRALTLALLDGLADAMRGKLGLTPRELPLARVLEGGSWRAGRLIAQELRPGGAPPLRVASDGTVF